MSEEKDTGALPSLLADPNMLSFLAQMLSAGAGQNGAPKDASSEEDSGAEHASAGARQAGGGLDVSSLLGGILSDPSAIESMMKLMPLITSMMSGMGGATEKNTRPSAQSAGAFALPGAEKYPMPVRATDRRSALLLALKPYMPKDKADMIDTIVRVIEIMSLIK